MKMTAEHYEKLAEVIKEIDTEERRERYRNRDFPRADAVQDLDKRYRWDLFYAAASYDNTVYGMFAGHDYADAHIYTALRRIVKPL